MWTFSSSITSQDWDWGVNAVVLYCSMCLNSITFIILKSQTSKSLIQALNKYSLSLCLGCVGQHNHIHTFKCVWNVMHRSYNGKFQSASSAAESLPIIFQLSSSAVCHNPQHPTDSPADSSGAPRRGIKWIVSTAMCGNCTAHARLWNIHFQIKIDKEM